MGGDRARPDLGRDARRDGGRRNGVDVFALYTLAALVNVIGLLWSAGVAMRFRTLQAAPLMQLPVFLSLFFAPVFVPVELLAGWLQTIAHLNPVTLMLAAGRGLIAGQPAHRGAFGAALALIALFLIWAVRGAPSRGRRRRLEAEWLRERPDGALLAGTITGIAYLVIGALGAWWPGHWDARAIDQIIWGALRRRRRGAARRPPDHRTLTTVGRDSRRGRRRRRRSRDLLDGDRGLRGRDACRPGCDLCAGCRRATASDTRA